MKHGILGKIFGGIFLAIGVGAIFLIPRKAPPIAEPQPIRPIKSFVVGEAFQQPVRYFPGTVRAGATVDLSFEVSGRLIEYPITKSMRVKKGDLIGRLDPQDFENQVKNAKAECDRAKSTLERMEKAVKSNAISREEYSRAKADYDKASANLAIREKALRETVLTAPFDGIIANEFADTFDMISAMKKVVTLQDVNTIILDVSIPESYIINLSDREETKKEHFQVVFDALPERTFTVSFKEFETSANPQTQTYLASFSLPAQPGLVILPGMSASLVVTDKRRVPAAELAIPSDATAIDSEKKHFVWLLRPETNGLFSVQKKTLLLGARNDDTVEVKNGLKKGDRIATAGISLLSEGRLVKLLQDQTENAK